MMSECPWCSSVHDVQMAMMSKCPWCPNVHDMISKCPWCPNIHDVTLVSWSHLSPTTCVHTCHMCSHLSHIVKLVKSGRTSHMCWLLSHVVTQVSKSWSHLSNVVTLVVTLVTCGHTCHLQNQQYLWGTLVIYGHLCHTWKTLHTKCHVSASMIIWELLGNSNLCKEGCWESNLGHRIQICKKIFSRTVSVRILWTIKSSIIFMCQTKSSHMMVKR